MATRANVGWELVDIAAHGPALHDVDRKLIRFLGKYIIKKRTSMSQARLKDYFTAVKADAEMVANDVTATTTYTRSLRRRNTRDFIAVAWKLMLFHEARQRFGRMLSWHKLLYDDADIPTRKRMPCHHTR